MRIIETKVYTINEHPNKELCYKYIRENIHDLGRHDLEEVIDSIKALNKQIGGEFDYSISAVPSRGEFIRFTNYDKDILMDLVADDHPLTGVFWDEYLIKGLRDGDTLNVLRELHSEVEYIYSDDGLNCYCMDNDFEFDELGKLM